MLTQVIIFVKKKFIIHQFADSPITKKFFVMPVSFPVIPEKPVLGLMGKRKSPLKIL